MKRKQHLKNKFVVITGASSGIGRATALTFAGHGAVIALVSRSRARLQKVASEIQRNGGRAFVYPCDVSSSEQVCTLAESLKQDFGRIDILINNAGSATVGPVDGADFAENIREMMEVDFFGTIRCTRALLPLIRSEKGQIVNMSSVVGRKAFPEFVGYSASMHAISGFSDGLRQELRDEGIAVTTIHPALTQTPLLARVDPKSMPGPFRHMTPVSVESVAHAVLAGVLKKRARVVVPWQPRVLMLLDAISPRLADSMVRLLGKSWFLFLLGMNKGRTYQHSTSAV